MAGFRNPDAIDHQPAFQPYSDYEWKLIESRFGGVLESLAATGFIMLMIFVLMAWLITHARVLLLLPH